MKSGTPAFVPSRLREAREARGLTVTSLADIVGVSTQAMSQYETGKHSPAPDVLRRIADKLSLPLHYFLRPKPTSNEGTKFWRSMSSATKAARTRAEGRYKWLREIVDYLQGHIKFPVSNIPTLDLPADPAAVSDDLIDEVATQVRRHWSLGDGPISNVAWLVENNGAVMARHRLDADKLDAFSEWKEGEVRPYIVLGSDKGSAARSRFDLAHELGHMVLHRHLSSNELGKSEVFNLIESQADKFAGAFLLPEATFSKDICAPTLDSLSSLKPKWKVSIGAMIARARQLGLISEDHEKRLWINRTRRGWRTKEPLDDILEPETPRFLRRSIELLVEKGGVARHDLLFQLALPPNDVEELTGLRPGYLTDANDGVSLLRMPNRETASGGPIEQHAADEPMVLPFPRAK